MVRFIIQKYFESMKVDKEIYIPIWLDLLCRRNDTKTIKSTNLHSNMVRFIIFQKWKEDFVFELFTFQYG